MTAPSSKPIPNATTHPTRKPSFFVLAEFLQYHPTTSPLKTKRQSVATLPLPAPCFVCVKKELLFAASPPPLTYPSAAKVQNTFAVLLPILLPLKCSLFSFFFLLKGKKTYIKVTKMTSGKRAKEKSPKTFHMSRLSVEKVRKNLCHFCRLPQNPCATTL